MNTEIRCWGRRLALGAGLVAVACVANCAGTGGSTALPGSPRPSSASPEARAREREAAQAYRRSAEQFDAANYGAADSLASRLVLDHPGSEWVGPALLLSARAAFELNHLDRTRAAAARYLRLYRADDPRRAPGLVLVARALYLEGKVVVAADSLLAAPPELGDATEEALQVARQVVAELGLGDIEAVSLRWPVVGPLRPVFETERASLLLAAGDGERARAVARAVLEGEAAGPERERARSIAAGELETAQWRPVIGAILPLTGPLAAYGLLAEEGIRLAVSEYNDRQPDDVTLIVRDDADQAERAGDLVRELEALGAVAVIGPLRSEGLEQASRERRDDDLLIVSPTADDVYGYARNTYSLWNTTERVAREARALGAFAVLDLRLRRIGVMYPNTPEGRSQLAAFANAVTARDGEIVAQVAYDDTATTFGEPLTALALQHPQAIFAPASTSQMVIQLAPQFSYYGLRGIQVLGDAEWGAPEVQRLVESRFINGTVIATFLYRGSPSVRWTRFVEQYERTYRKGLQDNNLVPALAYDATQLVLEAIPWGFPRRGAVARAFREIISMPGATGVFTVEYGAVTRRPFLLRFKDRELLPAYEGPGDLGAEPEREPGP